MSVWVVLGLVAVVVVVYVLFTEGELSQAQTHVEQAQECRNRGLASEVEAFSESVCGDIRQFAWVYRYDEITTKLCDDGLEITLIDSLNPSRKTEKFAVTDEGTYRLVGNDWQPVDA